MKKHFCCIGIMSLLCLMSCNYLGSKSEKSIENQQDISEIESVELPEETFITDSEDEIQVFTIKIGNDPEKSHLTASFPITAYDFVNQHEKSFTQTLIDEFRAELKENQEQSVISHLDFNQHFEVKYHTQDFLVFLYECNISYGNTYEHSYRVSIFDLKKQKKLKVDALFKDKDHFKEFANEITHIARNLLEKNIQESEHYADEQERKQALQLIEETLIEGTLPTAQNYDALFFDSKGQWYVFFDKYQIASGSMGDFSIEIPQDIIHKYIDDRFLQLFKTEEIAVESPNEIPSETKYAEVDCSKVPCVALTFDDGPSVYTKQLLDVLKEENVKATFFVLGKSASVQKQTLKRMAQEGHTIGNHSYDHKDFRKISNEEALRQIRLTDEIITEITGEKPKYFRFPYGAHTKENLQMVGRPVIMWNIDPLDWKYRDPNRIAQEMSKASPQAIILAHDIHKTTIQAIPMVIQNLKSQGYHIVSLDDLFRGKNLQNGHSYSTGK